MSKGGGMDERKKWVQRINRFFIFLGSQVLNIFMVFSSYHQWVFKLTNFKITYSDNLKMTDLLKTLNKFNIVLILGQGMLPDFT